MEDAKSREKGRVKDLLAERKSEATSDDQLSDLEEAEADSTSTDNDLDPGPSPDGMLDEPAEIKDAGPMKAEG